MSASVWPTAGDLQSGELQCLQLRHETCCESVRCEKSCRQHCSTVTERFIAGSYKDEQTGTGFGSVCSTVCAADAAEF